MKIFSLKTLGILLLGSMLLSSCVTSKKFKELQGKRDLTDKENLQLKEENRNLQTSNNEYSAEIAKYKKQVDNLSEDTTTIGRKYRMMAGNYKSLNKNYQDLLAQNQKLIKGNHSETKKILAQLQKSQADLIKREDSLAVLEKEFNIRKNELNAMSEKLAALQESLAEKEIAYNKLSNEVHQKDSLMQALKNSVADALVGFEKDGLTVSNRNGRVYVSMDNKLMFASGSFKVNPKGQDALKKLADVLKDKQDISILVEGHTDSIPYSGSGKLKDNWDLSAKRATSIVRILTKNAELNPSRITAAGRGEFSPIASNKTTEGRAKNRRTEIILMPDLNKLYKIISE